MRVLILEGAASRGCLAAARSLAAADWEVGVGHPPGHSLAASSSAVRDHVELPHLGDGLETYLRAVERHLRDGRYDLVLGGGDAEVLALAIGRDRLSARVPHPPPDVLTATMDKLLLHRAAVAEGVASPVTEIHENKVESAAWLDGGPIVVKPRLHWSADQLGHALRVEAGLAQNELQLRQLIDRVTSLGGQPVLQRFVAGRLVAYVALLDEEAGLVAHSQQRAVHTCPEPVGVSARAVTEDVNANAAACSMRLLRRLGITGLAELQYLVDENETYHLIDINARFYGSLQLAMSAGADMPSLWAETVTGRRTSGGAATVVSRPGVRYQWLEGDIRRSVARKSVSGTLGCLYYAGRAHHSIWSARDPGPAVAHVHELGRRAFRRMSGAA